MRRRHVVGIARFADAQQQHRVADPSCRAGVRARQTPPPRRWRCRRARRRRAAGCGRGELQGMKSVQSGETQGVGSAHQRRIDESCLDHAPRRAEHLGAGCAGRGHGHGRTFQPAALPDVICHRKGIVGGRVFETWRQSPAMRIARAIGEFGLQNARGARADEYPHAPAAPAGRRGLHRFEEAILLQGKLGQTVVAAIELLQIRPAGAVRRHRGLRRRRYRCSRTRSRSA